MLASVSRFFCIVLVSGLTGFGLSSCATSDNSANPAKKLAVMTGIATELPPAADFVAASRTGTLDYMPVGVMPLPPKKPLTALTPEELAALAAELEAARLRNEVAGTPKQ
jgi:hypothetical protein